MGDIVRFPSKQSKESISKQLEQKNLLSQALYELKQQTGIDYYKLLTGDKTEEKKLKFKQYQEKMKFDYGEWEEDY